MHFTDMGRAKRNHAFGHMRTAKAQVRLCARFTGWSGASLFASALKTSFSWPGLFELFLHSVCLKKNICLPYWPRQAKQCLRTCAKCADSDHHAHAQSHTALCSTLIQSMVSNDSISGQRRTWSDCVDVQADLGRRCPHMHGAAPMMT